MKFRKYIALLLVVCLSFSFSTVSFANEPSGSSDSAFTGVKSGSISISHRDEYAKRLYSYVTSASLTTDTDNGDGCIFIGRTSYHDGSNRFDRLYLYCVGVAQYSYYGQYVNLDTIDTIEWSTENNGSIYGNVSNSYFDRRSLSSGAMNTLEYTCETDIPIFDISNEVNPLDTQEVLNYVTTGDTSGAANSDSFADSYDSSIPLPHNLKVLSGTDQLLLPGGADSVIAMSYPSTFSKDIVLSWEQADVTDDLSYHVEGCISTVWLKEVDGELSEETFTSTTAYYDLVKETSYGGNKSITVTLKPTQLNTLKVKGWLSKMTIRVRNKSGGNTSNWVSITIDFKKKTATATEESYDDSDDTGGEEYNGDDVGGTPTLNFDDISIDGLMSFIKGGFGLLGDNGIIALMSKTFLYLPGNVWTIIYFFLAMMVVISIIKLIKGVVS